MRATLTISDRKPEERHSQIMEQMVQQLCQDYENRSRNVEQTCFNELAQQRANDDMRHEQVTAELANYMMSRTVAEQEIMNLRKELSDANAKLKNAANAVALEAEQRSNQKVSFDARQYEERYSELKMNLEADCKKIVDETVDYARQGMEDFKKEERAMIQEMMEECNRQEEQAAELNYQLQEGIDELVEKLNKQNVPTLRIEELDQGGHDIPVEAFATPKGNANVEAGATPMPNTASNLAAEAREILHSVFSTTPAGSTAPPQLPPLASARTSAGHRATRT